MSSLHPIKVTPFDVYLELKRISKLVHKVQRTHRCILYIHLLHYVWRKNVVKINMAAIRIFGEANVGSLALLSDRGEETGPEEEINLIPVPQSVPHGNNLVKFKT